MLLRREFLSSALALPFAGVKEDNAGRETVVIHGEEKLFVVDGKVIRIERDGIKHWYKDGELYRDDGPAIEYPDGTTFFWPEKRLGENHVGSR